MFIMISCSNDSCGMVGHAEYDRFFFAVYVQFFSTCIHMLFLLYGNNVQVGLCAFFWLEECYSYTEKTQQKGQRKQYKTKRNKGKLCTANNYIQ